MPLLALLANTGWAASYERSDLSNWLTEQAVAELQQMLAEHPRFAGQRVVVKRGNDNALTDALYTVLQTNLRGAASMTGESPAPGIGNAGQPASVDELVCKRTVSDYELLVTVEETTYRGASARVDLIDSYSASIIEQWRWQGQLSRAEREYIAREAGGASATGQLSKPWREDQVAEAAAALSRDFVCGLRPWVSSQTTLAWPWESSGLLASLSDTVLADTVRTSQHYIAAYKELAISRDRGQFSIETRTVSLSDGIWQLWLTANPREAGLPTVEVATYLLVPIPRPQLATAHTYETTAPRDALKIDVLGVSRQPGPRGADLVLRLRLSNTAGRALEYALRTSGGYFADCRGNSASYRHDAWGTTRGTLGARESRISSIRIENVLHQPQPMRGQSACAGFGDLAAFTNYPSQGERVTQYLRWEDHRED